MDFFSVCASVGERKYIHLSLDIVNALELGWGCVRPKAYIFHRRFLVFAIGELEGTLVA